MPFEVTVEGVPALQARAAQSAKLHFQLYAHAWAEFEIQRDEQAGYVAQPAAQVAAQALGAEVTVTWDENVGRKAGCFYGYVEKVTGMRRGGHNYIKLRCVSFSKRTDLVPRYRAFQACTLEKICTQIQRTEKLIRIQKASDLTFDIALSVQYGETDFAYLRRMMLAWGIPMAITPRTGEVVLGARGAKKAEFPSIDESWGEISFEGAVNFYETPPNGGTGTTMTALSKVKTLLGELDKKTNDYYAIPDEKPRRLQFSKEHGQADPVYIRVNINQTATTLLKFSVGQIVSFDGAPHIIRSMSFEAEQDQQYLKQQIDLQQYTLPYEPQHVMPAWPSRTLWAYVRDNEKDPHKEGRIQVEFEFEHLDKPAASANRAWLHMLTPYGGGKNPKEEKASVYSGFYSLPEVGERVLVEFLGDWDSEAVVIGAVRQKAVEPDFSAHASKRWRTPSGNEIVMTTQDSHEIVRIRCKNKLFFEAHMEGSHAEVYITPGESAGDFIHFKGSDLNIRSTGNITVHAKEGLHLEGKTVQIKAGGGPVHIDGSKQVLINTAPTTAPSVPRKSVEEKPPKSDSVIAPRPPTLPTPDN